MLIRNIKAEAKRIITLNKGVSLTDETLYFLKICLTLLFLQAKSKIVNPSVHIHLPCLHIPEL